MQRRPIMLTLALSLLLCVFTANVHAKYDTQYPVVLAHGMGASAEILGIVDYWWGIPAALENSGTEVYVTSVNGMDTTEAKAIDFKNQVMQILAISGAPKVNIIGHSHGTLYSRYAISNLNLAPFVASHTSIAGPHRGSSLADLAMGLPPNLVNLLGSSLDLVFAWVFGDTNPDSVGNGLNITTDFMKNIFNPNTPNINSIYYQSWAARAKTGAPSIVLQAPWLVMLALEGANDGLVGVNSAKWGNFRGVQKAAWYSPGCDHINITGHLFGITPGFNAPNFYKNIVADLKVRGF